MLLVTIQARGSKAREEDESEEEAEELWDGGEPCIHVIRPYSSPDHKKEVEDAHPPSTWRDTWTKASG